MMLDLIYFFFKKKLNLICAATIGWVGVSFVKSVDILFASEHAFFIFLYSVDDSLSFSI